MEELNKLPKETLLKLIQMYSRNWLTVDGLWFSGVEEKFGIEEALDLDIRMWRIGSRIEAKRIRDLLGLERGGIESILKAIHFMSWAACFGYRVEEDRDRAVWTCTHCPPQVNRAKAGLPEFACRPTFEACFGNLCEIIDPKVKVSCLICPPGPHPDDVWCQWGFSARA